MDLFARSDNVAKTLPNEQNGATSQPRSLLSSPLPSELPEPEVADAMIAQEMSNTSAQDLERAYFDVHGIVSNIDEVQETPELVNHSLQALHLQVQQLPDNAAYLKAKHQNEHYVSNRDFLLLFLRAEKFDIPAAALRLARHFQVKEELFGVGKLSSDIAQDDLDRDTMDTMYSGLTQHLPQTDRSGRTVVVFKSCGQLRHSTESKLKRMFYTSMVVFPNNAQTQKLGVVGVVYMLGPDKSEGANRGGTADKKNVWKICQLMRALPFRTTAIHICYDSLLWSPVIVTIKMAMTAFTRIRIKTHFGSHADCLAALQGYGIQPCFFPIKEEERIETNDYKTWLEGQRRKERRTMPRRNRIYVPGPFDVLFGKGSPLQNHSGNVKLRGLIADCMATYEKTEKGRKNEVTRAVIDTVKESSGLFLKQDGSDGWIAVDDAAAQLKVSTLFRSLRGGKKTKKAPISAGVIGSNRPQSLHRMGGIDTASFPPEGPSQNTTDGNDKSSDSNKKVEL